VFGRRDFRGRSRQRCGERGNPGGGVGTGSKAVPLRKKLSLHASCAARNAGQAGGQAGGLAERSVRQAVVKVGI